MWRSPETFDEAMRVSASRQQHALARAVRLRLFAEGLSIEQLANSMGHGYDQLWRKLAGVVPASTLDLNAWAAIADVRGVKIEPMLGDVDVPWPLEGTVERGPSGSA